MAPSSPRLRHNTEQNPARKRGSPLRRDTASPSSAFPTDTTTPSPSTTALLASPSSSTPGPPGVTLPPHGVSALVGIVVMLSLAVFGFSAWKIWVYRRKKKVAHIASTDKSTKPVGLFEAVENNSNMNRTMSLKGIDPLAFPPEAGSATSKARERTAAEVRLNLGYQPKVVYVAPKQKTTYVDTSPNTKGTTPPPGIKVTPPPGLQITPPPVYVSVPPAAHSPRTAASMAPRISLAPTTSKLPRLVVVESTYTPTLNDELEIREGETLHLLEEYEDEWCLVQRVGRKGAESGVVPRFCIVDDQNPTS